MKVTPLTARDIFDDAAAEFELRIADEVNRERIRREAHRRLRAEERGTSEPPAFESLRAYLSRPAEPIRYRIAELQPLNARVMLAAQFKTGKTTMRDNVVKSLVDHLPLLGTYDVMPLAGSVAILDFEMSATQLSAWLRDQGIVNDDRVVLVSMRGRAASFDIIDPDIRAEWAGRLRACGCAYAVLDCLRPVLDALGLDEHKDAGRFLVAYDALLAEAGISESLVVHHMGHNGERSRGDSRLRDWPDVEWRMVRQDDDPASPRYFTAYGRDVDVHESQIEYDATTRRLSLVGGSRRDVGNRDVLAAVASVIGDGEMSRRAIKDALKESEHSRAAIEAAIDFGARTGALARRDGPKNASLYRVSVPVFGSVPPVSRNSASECPAPIGGGTLGHTIGTLQCPDSVCAFDPSAAFSTDGAR